jgi:hypothetical protein
MQAGMAEGHNPLRVLSGALLTADFLGFIDLGLRRLLNSHKRGHLV